MVTTAKSKFHGGACERVLLLYAYFLLEQFATRCKLV